VKGGSIYWNPSRARDYYPEQRVWLFFVEHSRRR
jgi:hypothetical protein